MNETKRLLLGGFWATCLMTIFLDLAMRFGSLNLDFASMLAAGTFLKPAFVGSPLWWYGLALHFFIGSVCLSLFYGRVFRFGVAGPGALKGLQYGAFLWFIFMFIVMPMMGKGFFATATPKPLALNLWILGAHLIYGTSLGAASAVLIPRRHFESARALRV